MIKRAVLVHFLIIVSLVSFPLSVQAVSSNCIVLNENPPVNNLPPHCASSQGVTYPPNLGTEDAGHKGYYLMPPSTNGAYRFEVACPGQHHGSRELIGVLYTVAQNWKKKYPKGHLNIGDLNATGHKSHTSGIDVDMDATTNGSDHVADYTKGSYNRAATVELGKMFVDTGQIQIIFYNDMSVNRDVNGYAKRTVMDPEVGHTNHFHVRIHNKWKLGYWEPGC